jgi:mono/diheme cytochrome c family protein
MRQIITFLVAFLGIAALDTLYADAVDPASAARGRVTYTRVGCYQCHGYEAQGGSGGGPRLAPGPLPYEAISAFVRGSRGEMPAYREKVLSDTEMQDIYAFLKSVPAPKSVEKIPALNELK